MISQIAVRHNFRCLCGSRHPRDVRSWITAIRLYGNTDMGSAAWRQDFTNFAAAAAAHFKGQGNI